MTKSQLQEWKEAFADVPIMQEWFSEIVANAQQEVQRKVAKAMLAKKMDITLISEVTGLFKTEIEKLC